MKAAQLDWAICDDVAYFEIFGRLVFGDLLWDHNILGEKLESQYIILGENFWKTLGIATPHLFYKTIQIVSAPKIYLFRFV